MWHADTVWEEKDRLYSAAETTYFENCNLFLVHTVKKQTMYMNFEILLLAVKMK